MVVAREPMGSAVRLVCTLSCFCMLWSLPDMCGVMVLTRHWKQLPLGVEALASSGVCGHYRGSGLLGVDGHCLSPFLGTAVTFTFPLTGSYSLAGCG